MEIYESTDHGAAVLTLEGKLMGDPDTKLVHVYVKRLVDQGFKFIILDLKQLQWLNSAGMGTLIASFTTLRKHGGSLILAGACGKTQELLKMTHLDQVFQEYDSVKQAMEAMELGKRAMT